MQNKSEDTSTMDKINIFVQKNRKALFIVLGIIVLLFAGSLVFFSLSNHLQNKAIAEAEELSLRYAELNFYDEAAVEALLGELNAFAKRKTNFAGGRAWSLIGQIYTNRKEWQNAEDAWYKAAQTASKTYLGPIAYFNAAAAAEEQGKLERAIELYSFSISHRVDFPSAPRAQFSIGRLNEQLGNFSAAIEAYRIVLIRWPNITTWANLAQSRITTLEIR